MHGISAVRFGVGVVGNVVSGVLFLSPLPTFWRIYKNKSTEDFQPYPYLATIMNCMLWIFYGLPIVHPDSTLVITINSFGLFCEIIYLLVFLWYNANNERNKYKWKIFGLVLLEFVALAAIVAGTLLGLHTTAKRSIVVGILCDIFGIIMYASPLFSIVQVIKTQSVKYVPIPLTIVGFLNGIIWFVYAFLKTFDPYIAAGNGLGALFSLIQLAVVGYYKLKSYLKNKKGAKGDAKPGDVQLSSKDLPI